MPAQTLSRPNWAGSGISTELWWKNALFYRIDTTNIPPDGLRGLAERLETIQALGVDALWIDPFQPSATTLDALNPALGDMADIDNLISAASRQKIRVVVDLPASATPDAARSIARFWLTRGAVGLYLKGTADNTALLHDLRKTEATFAGERILIADAEATQTGHPDDVTLRLQPLVPPTSELSAASLRYALKTLESVQASDRAGTLLLSLHPAAGSIEIQPLATCLSTILMTSRGSITLFAGQAAPQSATTLVQPDADPYSVANLYRQMTALRRGNRAIRSGDLESLSPNGPAAAETLVWLRRAPVQRGIPSPVVIACNLSAQPVRLSLTSELARMHLRGTWMRTILRSYSGFGPEKADRLTLPAFGVYLGELHDR